MTSRISLKQIANQLGISPRAVSQALRSDGKGTTRVAADTIERVRAAAREGGYRMNTSARALRTNRFRQAGFLIRYDFRDTRPPVVEAPALFGMGERLNACGWHLIVVQGNSDVTGNGAPVFVREHSLDGVVIASTNPEEDERHMNEMNEAGVPYVWFNSDRPVNAVGILDEVGAELATQHLIELQHKRIVFVASHGLHYSAAARERGYTRVMKSYGLEPIIWDCSLNTQGESGYDQRMAIRSYFLRMVIEELLPRHKPTAIVCVTDTEAILVCRALHTAGIDIPGDISVVGYNDLPSVDIAYPPLTTVHADFYTLGSMAAEMLLELLDSDKTELKSRFLHPRLVVRNSTSPAPRVK